MSNKELQNSLQKIFIEFGAELGLALLAVQESAYTTSIYLSGSFTLELEIDWHEYNICVYAVKLRDNRIPPKDIIYTYKDGQWCRKYIEEIYHTQRPVIHKQMRYQPKFLFDSLKYYISLISNEPMTLLSFLDKTIEQRYFSSYFRKKE